jgi:hypothetical protein
MDEDKPKRKRKQKETSGERIRRPADREPGEFISVALALQLFG